MGIGVSETIHVRHCSICHKDIPADLRSPFCSDRCRQIDLSRWLSEEYRIRRGEGEGEGSLMYSQEAGDDGKDEHGEEE